MQKLTVDLLKDLKLTPLDNVEAVRRQGNAYALDREGKLVAVSMTEKDLEELYLDEDCAHLEHLYLGRNKKLSKLEFKVALPELTHLYLNDCSLKALHIPAGFIALKQLYVQNNQFEELVFEGDCPELELLDGSGNGMKDLVMPDGFRYLKYIHLQKNLLESLPECFVGMRQLDMLFLSGNPLSTISQDVVGSGDTHNSAPDILTYLMSIHGKKTRYLHEAKMILVGNPMVGKSSIRIKLKDPQAPLPEENDRTPGLDVEPYLLKNLPGHLTQLDENIDFQLNIWDFGGQGRYREIQQLFCSRKSLYLYVTSYDDQPDNEDYIGLDYWLSMVNAYSFDQDAAEASPVIYVLNKVDSRDDGINETLNREKYKNLVKFVKISCKNYAGFDQLVSNLREILPSVSRDIFSNRFNLEWFRVKARLEGSNAQHLTYGAYLGICKDEGLDTKEAQTWLTVLDRIGSVIYTGNFVNKEDWIIINPNWVKDAICRVIDSPLMQRDGILKEVYFDTIWSEYPDAADRANLVKLMLNDKYKLAYEITSLEGETDYMVPAALFNKGKPALNRYPVLQQAADYTFQFCFEPFIPAGMVNKLLVSLNAYIYNGLIWGNGGVLHDASSNTFALVEEDWQNRRIQAEFRGTNPAVFYEMLVTTLEKITEDLKNSRFLHHLKPGIKMKYEGDFLDVELLKKFGKFPWEEHSGEAGFRKTNPNPTEKERIRRELIANDQLLEALEAMETLLPEEEYDSFVNTRGRLKNLDRDVRDGTISPQEAGLERNKIRKAVQNLCDTIKMK
ncbi:COR domain-containing protein [Haliscomenobacter sp.]|uniref:COR domain-containing protein n=1 Tax=Haliscomenobacter sp. TaxID=2717303 RepID=UPI0035942503